MESIWSKEVEIPRREPLDGNLFTEAAVIGAGMTGILTAYFLQEIGFHVVVLEADRIGSGQTKNTTAKITSQHGLIYDGLIKKLGERKAELYAKANEEAITEYEKLIEKHQIECHFEKLPSYLYSTEKEECLKREAEAAAKLGIKATFTKETKLPFSVCGAVRFEEQAQFHPLEFIKEISKDLMIYEQTKVLKVKKNRIMTNRGTVRADHIVFATHYPILNVPGFYFLRQHQDRSYVVALEKAEPLDGMYYSIDEDGLSLRSEGNVLLLGGGAHRTGKAEEAAKYFPDSKIAAKWSAQDCVTHDGLPFVGRYSLFRPDWYVATGYKKWGMTTSMIAARILCDSICGMENPYALLFTPKRFSFYGFSALIKDIGESVIGLSKGAFHLPMVGEESLGRGEGGIVRIGMRRYACYRDKEGRLHKISARCPHMGCELAWNPEELSWDCPCHGSRFDCDGKLLDNPAQVDKE